MSIIHANFGAAECNSVSAALWPVGLLDPPGTAANSLRWLILLSRACIRFLLVPSLGSERSLIHFPFHVNVGRCVPFACQAMAVVVRSPLSNCMDLVATHLSSALAPWVASNSRVRGCGKTTSILYPASKIGTPACPSFIFHQPSCALFRPRGENQAVIAKLLCTMVPAFLLFEV